MKRRVAAAMLAISGLTLATGVVGSIPAGAAAGPKVGGSIVVGGWSTLNGLDQGQSNYSNNELSTSALVFGELFAPPVTPTNPPQPSLALSYSYSKHNTELTLNLRHGVKFQDGTPFNAQAVVWNFQHYASPGASSIQDFATVASEKAVGKYTVEIRFTEPDAAWINFLDSTTITGMGSPTAYASLGATAYSFKPVGAGPYTVTTDTPDQDVILQRWPGYWDAKQTYLQQITFTNTGTNANSQYEDLASGAVTAISFQLNTTAPTALQQSDANTSLSRTTGRNFEPQFIWLNPTTTPFNNPLAREAVSECINRQQLADDVYQGYATPDYIMAGPGVNYSSGLVKGKLVSGWQYGESLNPWPYNPTNAAALVKQIGGLSFTLKNPIANPNLVPTAIAQQLSACGINVNVLDYSVAGILEASGNFQAGIAVEGVTAFPGDNVAFQTYGGATDNSGSGTPIPGFVTNITKSFGTSNQTLEADYWHNIWHEEDETDFQIPYVAAPIYYYENQCLKGLNVSGLNPYPLGLYEHAHLTCTPS